MPLRICKNDACSELNHVHEKEAWDKYCGQCGEQMSIYAPPQRFLDAVVLMRQRMRADTSKDYTYPKQVVEHLLKCEAFFQDDFIDEMNKPSELDKFLGLGTPRSTDSDKVCVDNALSSSQTPNRSGHPAGEKFTFEVPFIMEKCGWTFLNRYKVFADDLSAFADVIEASSQYLVVVKQPASTIGHMVMIVTDNKNNAFLIDKQKQPRGTYVGVKYIAWKSSQAAPASIPRPYCSIDLANSTLGSWTN